MDDADQTLTVFSAIIGRQSEGSLIQGFDNLVLTPTLTLGIST